MKDRFLDYFTHSAQSFLQISFKHKLYNHFHDGIADSYDAKEVLIWRSGI